MHTRATKKRPVSKRLRLRMDRLKRRFAGRFGALPQNKKWVFIISCTNSGSTVLHELLAAHPDIASMRFEGQHYQDQLPLPTEDDAQRLWALTPKYRLDENSKANIDVNRIKRQWSHFMNYPTRGFYLEKSPPNAVRTRWLQKHFPQAYFIALVRNGYAVAEGIARRTGVGLEAAARQWNTCLDVMLDDFTHLERKILIRYEDLIESPDAVIARVLTFLGTGDKVTSVREREYRIHGQVQAVSRQMNERSIGSLSEVDLALIEDIAERNLRRFGYLAQRAEVAVG